MTEETTVTTESQGVWRITHTAERIDIHDQHGEHRGVYRDDPMLLAMHVVSALAALAELRERIEAAVIEADDREAYACVNAMRGLLRDKPVAPVCESEVSERG